MDDKCIACGNEIKVAIFKGSSFCSVDCKKSSGLDTPSVGTYMFLTRHEADALNRARAIRNENHARRKSKIHE